MSAKVPRGPTHQHLKAYYLTMGCKVGVYVWQSRNEEEGDGSESGIWLDFVAVGTIPIVVCSSICVQLLLLSYCLDFVC